MCKGKGVFVEMAFTNSKKMYKVSDLYLLENTTEMPLLSVMISERESVVHMQERVLVQLREESRETIHNSRKVCSIVEIIVLCG